MIVSRSQEAGGMCESLTLRRLKGQEDIFHRHGRHRGGGFGMLWFSQKGKVPRIDAVLNICRVSLDLQFAFGLDNDTTTHDLLGGLAFSAMAGLSIDINSSIHCEVLVHIKYGLRSHNVLDIHSKCRKVHLSLNNVYITTIGASGFENNTAGPDEPYIRDPFAVAATDSAKVKDENDVPCRGSPAFGDCVFIASCPKVILGSGFACQTCTRP